MPERNQKRPRHSAVWILVMSCLTWTYSLQNDMYIITFKEHPYTHNVSAGSVVHLRCWLTYSENVTFLHESNVLVELSFLNGSRSKYSYNWTLHDSENVLHELVLNDVDDSDGGKYWCLQKSHPYMQTDLEVLHNPQDKPRCNATRVEASSSNKYKYQFSCSTKALDPQVNISLFLNERPVTETVSIISEREGERKEKLSWFSSYLDDMRNDITFYCIVTHEMPSLYIHYEKYCSLTVPHHVDTTSVTVPATSVHRQDFTTVTTEPQSNNSGSINVAVLAAGFLVMSLLLILIGIKCIRKLVFANCDSGKSFSHAIQHYQVANEPTENEESVMPSGNFIGIRNATASRRDSNESFASMIMVNNEIYESSNDGLLAGKTMVQNEFYESVVDVKSCKPEKEIYSTIQRNEFLL